MKDKTWEANNKFFINYYKTCSNEQTTSILNREKKKEEYNNDTKTTTKFAKIFQSMTLDGRNIFRGEFLKRKRKTTDILKFKDPTEVLDEFNLQLRRDPINGEIIPLNNIVFDRYCLYLFSIFFLF